MSFDGVLGHASAIEVLRGCIRSGRLPRALLFQGPEGVGKGTVARELARALLCDRGDSDRPDACGRCATCTRADHGNHPDLFVLTRLPRKKAGAGASDLSSFIVIDQIRELSEHAVYAPREGRYRVFLVDPADRMNAEAQNALLKTLEEPPGRALLVLVASRPHVLLPTVRSRCLALRFAPLRTTELASALESRGMRPDEALARAALAAGRPGRALEIDVDEAAGRRDDLLEALERLAGSPRAVAELPAVAARLAGTDEDALLAGLDLMETLLRDAARASREPSALVNADRADRLAGLGQRIGEERASALVRSLEKLRGELRFNLNRVLIAESLLAAVAGGPIP